MYIYTLHKLKIILCNKNKNQRENQDLIKVKNKDYGMLAQN